MAGEQGTDLCTDDAIARLVAIASDDDQAGLAEADRLIRSHPDDPRLHFLKGSLLAALGQYEAGEAAMSQAVAIAPDYEIARFQLGLLQLSSGKPTAAETSLAPLLDLADSNPLKIFAEGLMLLMRDQLAAAADRLSDGIALNTAFLPLNRDMQMLIDETRSKLDEARGEEPMSSTQQLLQTYSSRQTRH